MVADNLRQNEVALSRDVVLRISLTGLRLAGEAFLDQIEAASTRAKTAGLGKTVGIPTAITRIRLSALAQSRCGGLVDQP